LGVIKSVVLICIYFKYNTLHPFLQPFNELFGLCLAAGGIAYTVGAILYSIKKIPYNHAIFHVFVLIGSACHFISVYWYV